ncbi:receptor-like protein EIX2 [Oryza brachyantha]|uniref:Leucine-rich repeat-containing N-terminal plant-type domain-containing protein n=1 Tax=Oryza brachyantha TaxID=4533 RepID=J3N0M8_ORYBR|nr:receptor-like protein EIX2 [Oryza brachyantha]
MDGSSAMVVLLIGASFSFFLTTHAVNTPSCTPQERDALLSFKQGITNDSLGLLSSWRRGHGDCCSWTGVTCSSKTGHVVKLDVNNFITDSPLVGQISPSLLSLEHLQYLDLSTNLLAGPKGSVPEFLGSMKNLMHLDLSYIPFSGTVPPLLSNLTNLEYLDLSFTSFSGRLPPQLGNLSNLRHLDVSEMNNVYSTDISWLSRLHLLEYVAMSSTNLSKITDLPVVLNEIPALKQAILSNCSLPSANQSITHLNLTKLEELDLSLNYFGHPIASCWFWEVTSIKSLRLDETHLHGPFPDALGEMVLLQHLDFTSNGNAATITVDLKNLCDLESIYLDKSLSSGNITDLFDKLQCSSKLHSLSSSSNNMTGMLPTNMVHFTSLNHIDLTNNSVSGVLPRGIRKMTSLEYLHLSSNRLSGQMPLLPASLKIFHAQMNFLSGHLPLEFRGPNLENLIISSNHIAGQVPGSICESENMKHLDLSNNLFEGELPHCSRMRNLRFLLLGNNSFSGNFPHWIQSFSSLVFLDLSWNKFHGSLPRWIGDLVTLRILHLGHNMFNGDIPFNITDLRDLQYLNLADNSMSGLIPLSLSNFNEMTLKAVGDSMSTLAFDESLDTFSLAMKHEILKYGSHGVVDMVGIDLSLNRLTGGIPDEITSLDRLSNLNLSWNLLSGIIPENIGSMKSIESLDLSRNYLCGEVPSSLTDLTYLSYLDLSYNNLTGKVPSGRQLDTLYIDNPSVYNGNIGLCGPPLQKNCSSSSHEQEHGDHKGQEKDSNSMFFYYGLGSGFIVGYWVVFCALLFNKLWRVHYFCLVDKVYDKLCVSMVITWTKWIAKRNTTN